MKTRNGRRKGFTLVELLVVISIIGMLMALLLPAVQSARESGRSNTCRNNMRNLSLATIQYESARNIYPGYDNDILTTNAASVQTNGNDRRSWTFVILPYMDHRSLYDKHKNNNTANSDIGEGLEITICPSNPPETIGGTSTSYVVNSGQLDNAPTATLPADYQANGVFHYSKGAAGSNGAISMAAAYIAGQDGLGTTIMMSENADSRNWTDVDERWTGFTYDYDNGTPGPTPSPSPGNPTRSLGLNINFGQSKNSTPQDTSAGWARPSSFHPNGINFVFCDGHVRFVSDTIAYGVFQALMTPRGSAAYNNNTNVKFVTTPIASAHAATTTIDENAIP
jgi:prepilin-type N-terminal cleavage/methylation domain-containing protein/prepilin-type processing-associated H-X9-DG protein